MLYGIPNTERGERMDSINEQVGAYLARTGMTRTQLAKKLNMSRSALRSKLKGETEFTLREGYVLKELLHISADALFADMQPVE